MRIGFGLPVSGAWASPQNISHFATRAEQAGYASLWTFQRLLVPQGSAMEPVYHSVLDPVAALAYTAAVTTRIRLGVAVINAPYISPGYVAQGITYEWCRRGLLPPQIERLKKLYAPRLDACLSAIDTYMPDAVATRPDGGFFISLTLPQGIQTTAVRLEAAKRGLNLADGLAFFPEGGGERFLRLPFCALSPAEVDEGVRRLAETVKMVRTA